MVRIIKTFEELCEVDSKRVLCIVEHGIAERYIVGGIVSTTFKEGILPDAVCLIHTNNRSKATIITAYNFPKDEFIVLDSTSFSSEEAAYIYGQCAQYYSRKAEQYKRFIDED